MTTLEINTINTHASTPLDQNDAAATHVTKASALRLIEQLVDQRSNWEMTAYKTSNDMLYGVLQGCYGLYKTMCGSGAEAKAAQDAFQEYLESKKLNFTKSTHTISKIVRCVFGDNRRRVSAYSIVLQRALADEIPPLDLPAFIRNAGGVEEVRLAKSKTAMTPLQRSNIADQQVRKTQLAKVKSERLSKSLDLAKTGQRIVLLATQEADGEVVIHAVLTSESILQSALSSLYSLHKKSWEAEDHTQSTKTKEAEISDAVDRAAQIQLAA